MSLLLPAHVTLLLEYYSGAELPPRDDSTFQLTHTQELLRELTVLDLMHPAAPLPADRPTNKLCWMITSRGKAHCAALLRVHTPVERTEWVTAYPTDAED